MIQNTFISDVDENYAPPEEPVLKVGLVGDVAFLTIGNWEETADSVTFRDIPNAQVAISVADLTNALKTANLSNLRHDYVRQTGDHNLVPVNL